MEWKDPGRPVRVTVRYVTRRGQWFGISWKGDPAGAVKLAERVRQLAETELPAAH